MRTVCSNRNRVLNPAYAFCGKHAKVHGLHRQSQQKSMPTVAKNTQLLPRWLKNHQFKGFFRRLTLFFFDAQSPKKALSERKRAGMLQKSYKIGWGSGLDVQATR